MKRKTGKITRLAPELVELRLKVAKEIDSSYADADRYIARTWKKLTSRKRTSAEDIGF